MIKALVFLALCMQAVQAAWTITVFRNKNVYADASCPNGCSINLILGICGDEWQCATKQVSMWWFLPFILCLVCAGLGALAKKRDEAKDNDFKRQEEHH